MANFQDSRFLGLSPRAVGLGIVAVAVVVGLFFIPETVKLLFDPKPRSSKDRVVASRQAPAKSSRQADEAKAALAPDALNALNTTMQRPEGDKGQTDKANQRGAKMGRKGGESEDGLFSGWNFQVKADHGGGRQTEIPASLSFDKLGSKEGVTFFRKARTSIGQFVRAERGLVADVEGAVTPLAAEVDLVASGAAKNVSVEEMTGRLKQAHLLAMKGLRGAGADRGVMMRWLNLPVVKFIDQRGQIFLERKLRSQFYPAVVLSDLSVQQNGYQGWNQAGAAPAMFRANFDLPGSDVERVAVYSSGRLLRSFRLNPSRDGTPRSVKLNGDAAGVLTVVAYDRYGGRPYSKSYAFYPKVRVFRQTDNGVFQIGFLPGSARNSLDRFFYVGGTTRSTSSDPMISQF